ncbi:acyltransferase [Streptomyces sp. NPDC006450]|uniref:acyltransferase family protein n=1 Tax=Streptomyces sp. NPDC006450 TaxID=3155458 RepID=UPI0033A8BD3C
MSRSAPVLPGRRGTLGELYSPRANSFGVLRLVLASSVVLSHVWPIGWGPLDPLWTYSGAQTDVGKMAVVGFFVLSGFMITGSGARGTCGRYAWHRALRILPGLWGSLLVSALVVLPLLYAHLHGTTDGYWNHREGPVSYLQGTWNTSVSTHWDISGVLSEGKARGTNFDPGVNGALWSLKYEVFCYVMVGLLAASGALRRARRLVPLTAAVLGLLILRDWVTAPSPRGIPGDMRAAVQVPLLGSMSVHFLIHLCFVFLIGATFQLYRDRVPVHDGLALICAAVLGGTLVCGGVFVLGYPAFAYLLLWLAIRLPRPFRRIGRERDYSYGIYIYGFTVEQALALLGYARYGKPVFLLLAMAGTLLLAALSWHLVESQAMKLKNWTPRFVRGPGRRGSTAVRPRPEPRPAVGEPEPAPTATTG